jgi:putative ABC transport system permease protein
MARRSLRSWLWSVPLEQEVDEELAFHIEMRTRELIASGMDPAAARAAAQERADQLAGVRQTLLGIGRQRDREMRLTQWIDEIRRDVTFALRQMRRAPGFTLVATLTLALGIGANSAIFALADGVLLRPLPFPHAERLVAVNEWGPGQGGRSRVELLNLHEWQRTSRTVAAMAATWVPGGDGGATMVDRDGIAVTVATQTVTPNFFDTLGVIALVGRTFAASDDGTDPRVLVLSERFWKSRFGGDPNIVGRTITLDERPHIVVGVVPDRFEFIRPASIWRLLPLPRIGAEATGRGQCGVCRLLMVIGRLQPDTTIETARAELTAIANAIAERTGEPRRPRRIEVTLLRDVVLGRELRLTAALFLGVVGLLLLLCCANVANLVLARSTVRRRELAVRGALGASRRRLAAQLLTENILLASLGAIVGIAIATAILAAAPSFLPRGLMPGIITLTVDVRVVTFCAGSSLLMGLLFGLVPLWQTTRTSLAAAIAFDPRTASEHGTWLRRTLVAGEIAAAVIALCSGGLLLRTLLILDGFDQGYRANRRDIVSTELSIPALRPGTRYPTEESLVQFMATVRERVAATPGVRGAAWATTLPLGDPALGSQSFQVVGDPIAPPDSRPQADLQLVSDSYFDTIDLPIVSGRPFTPADRSGTAPVAVVNEAFVDRYLPGRNPIGTRIAVRPFTGDVVEREIVGIARQVKGRPEESEPFAQLYLPAAQVPWSESSLVVHTEPGQTSAVIPAIRKAVSSVDRLLAVDAFVTFDELAREATARPRFRTTLVAGFAALSLVLALVGVFGVLTYSVQQRRREFGIRLALGATAQHVRTLVLTDALRVVGIGAAAGLIGALVLGRLVSAFLFGVQPRDPLTFGLVTVLIAVTAFAAAAFPAWRASGVDPAQALRD